MFSPPQESLRKALSYPPFHGLLALGIALRGALMALYFPAVMLMFDSPRYARAAGMHMFGDFWMPAGYPIFLASLRLVSHQLWFTIAVQHALGLGTATLLYLAVWRLGVRRRVACIPGGVALVSGDHLYLEHMVMADFFFTFMIAAGLCATVYGLTSNRSSRCFALAGACFASAALIRTPGLVLLPIAILCLAFRLRGSIRLCLGGIAWTFLGAATVFSCYLAAFLLSGGKYLGLADMRGWNVYSRVAPFADCSRFIPPKGTARLCEQRPFAERPGPFGYVWDSESIARRKFPLGPESGKKLAAFAYQVIRNQPGDYMLAVTTDLVRYIAPSVGPQRSYGGQPREILSFGWRDPNVEEMVVRAMAWVYDGTTVRVSAPAMLAGYQRFVRLQGPILFAALLFTVVGWCWGRGELRMGAFVFGLSALGLYVFPVLTVSYDFRYGIPPSTFLCVSGLLGMVAAAERRQLRSARNLEKA